MSTTAMGEGARVPIADSSAVERRVLPSGLRFLGRNDVENDIVAVKLHVRLGCLEESDSEAGLSALLARLLLKSTKRRTAAQVATDIESKGGRLTTGGTKEAETISLLCARDVLDPCLDLLVEVATEPAFLDHELEVERQATLARIRARKDQLLGQAFDFFHELYYGRHPYHKPSIGYESTVHGFRPEDVRRLYERTFATENMVASVVGRVDLDRVAARLDSGLAPLNRGRSVLSPAEVPAPAAGEVVVERREAQTAWIVVGYPAPPMGHPDSAAMAMFASVLGGSMDSRLFTELRDKRGLAYEIGALYAGYVGPAFLAVYMGTRASQEAEARAGLIAEVERLRDGGPAREERDRARNFMRGSQLMAHERNANRASSYGLNELLGLGYDYADRFLAALDEVKTVTVRQVADTWLKRPSVAVILPNTPGPG
jgi:predicted Zn-dependent peptidase